MPDEQLEQVLRNLPQTGKLVKDAGDRQVWRFEWAGAVYYLKFHPAGGLTERLWRRVAGSKAMREFQLLQRLQKASVPTPRPIAAMLGFSIAGRKGDAVIVEGLEPSEQLDRYLSRHELGARDIPDHLGLAKQVRDLVEKLGRAGMGHGNLQLSNMLITNGRVYLMDGQGVHATNLKMREVMLLAHSATRHATRTDLYRAWRQLGPGGAMPAFNSVAPASWRRMAGDSLGCNRHFGQLASGQWTGHFFKRAELPYRWSAASKLEVSEEDWRAAWPILEQQIASDQFEVLKRGESGDVLAGEIVLGGRPLSVVVKRPVRKYWYRYINEIGRGSRPRRAWIKAWKLIARHIPTAWPLLFMEKRRFGYVTDAMMVCERIAGHPLSSGAWAAQGPERYHVLLHRVGRLLRRLEETRLFLYDAKADNWMVRDDADRGPEPLLVDTDGIRRFRVARGGLNRLLRSLRENRAVPFTAEDALALARGYAPFASTPEHCRLCGIEAKIASASAKE